MTSLFVDEFNTDDTLESRRWQRSQLSIAILPSQYPDSQFQLRNNGQCSGALARQYQQHIRSMIRHSE